MVFISYSHESEEHSQRVLALADMLLSDSIDAVVDRYVTSPPGGWHAWTQQQIDEATHVICVCTPTYLARFNGGDATARGVGWEGMHIRSDVYRRTDASRYLVLSFSELSVEDIPSCLQGASRYVVGSEAGYAAVRNHLRGVNPFAPAPLGKPYDGTRATLQLDFSQAGSPRVAPRPRPRVSAEHVASRVSAGDCALLRVTFEHLGDTEYQVSIERRAGAGQSFEHSTHEWEIGTDLAQAWDLISTDPDVAALLTAARADARPTRLQLRFAPSAKALDAFHWESALVDGQPLHTIPQIVLSRAFVLQDGDAPEIRVSPKSELEFTQITVRGTPIQRAPGDMLNAAPQFDVDESLLFKAAFPRQVEYRGQEPLTSLPQVLGTTDVLFLPLRILLSPTAPRTSGIVLPDQGQLSVLTPHQFARRMQALPERPIVMFLAPATWDFANQKEMFDFSNRVARECAAKGITSVIALSQAIDPKVWHRFVTTCAQQLLGPGQDSGIIDAAVAAALHAIPQLSGLVRTYLRNRSARLWYRAGLVSSGSKADWGTLREAMRKHAGELCAVLGPGIDRTLNLSRRAIARRMAQTKGFSLSSRDEENLARVAEYIRVRGGPSDASGLPPHVAAFVHEVRDHLLGGVIQDEQQELAGAPIDQVASVAGRRRLRSADSPYRRLASLRARCFVTTNFHSLIEQSLRDVGRTPIVANFRGEHDLDPDATLERPIVYHAFGSFEEARHMAIAESDHLDFLSEFVHDESRHILRRVRAHMLKTPLLFLGFHPESWEFRALFWALTRMPGASSALYNVHIAVQVDPEDDRIIDPDNARTFYEGLLAPLGQNVYVYWGRTEQFLAELATKVPELFLDPAAAGEVKATA